MLVAILLGLAVILSLSDIASAVLQKRNDYIVQFDVASGVANLQPGSTVRVGGLSMGRVTVVEPARSPDSDTFGDVIRVQFELDDRFALYTDARIYVAGPLIGSDAWLEIVNFGGHADQQQVANADNVIAGESASMLETLLGADGGRIMANVAAFTDEFSSYDQAIDQILSDTETITGNVSGASAEIGQLVTRINQEDWPEWTGRVSTFLMWTNEVTDELDQAVGAGHDLLASANAVITDNRSKIDSTLSNVEETTGSSKRIAERFEQHTLAQAEELLGKAGNAVDSASDVLEQASVDYPDWASSLSHTMANGNLASQQLKLAIQEIRRNPWKLLYQPTPDELDFELLYDAARSFSLATVDLRAASESLERSLDKHSEVLSERQDLRERITRGVVESLENYERAQQRLFEVLKLGSTAP